MKTITGYVVFLISLTLWAQNPAPTSPQPNTAPSASPTSPSSAPPSGPGPNQVPGGGNNLPPNAVPVPQPGAAFIPQNPPPDSEAAPSFPQPQFPQPSVPQPQSQPSSGGLPAADQGAKLPDLELISIKPYFKNKGRVGHFSSNLIRVDRNETIASLNGDFGDCANCSRGVSVKGKVGLRIYGQDMNSLKISRKSSLGVSPGNCPVEGFFINNFFVCEFTIDNIMMKLDIRVQP